MALREERIAENEAMFRAFNEGIASWSGRQDAAATARIEFYCECGDRTCFERVELTGPEYEALRQNSARFAVLPWHVIADVERVVETRPGYVIIEKHERFRHMVERSDPRRDEDS
jgi:hypothetical protein